MNSPTSTIEKPFVKGSWRNESLKSSTKNPDLNLSKLSTSLTWKVFVSSSNKESDVVSSRVYILSSSLPMSLIVYLLLSTALTSASSTS